MDLIYTIVYNQNDCFFLISLCYVSSISLGWSLTFTLVILFALTVIKSQNVTRTSDGGNGNHSVSLPIILIKIKVDQMLPSSYISSLLVSILCFCI